MKSWRASFCLYLKSGAEIKERGDRKAAQGSGWGEGSWGEEKLTESTIILKKFMSVLYKWEGARGGL